MLTKTELIWSEWTAAAGALTSPQAQGERQTLPYR